MWDFLLIKFTLYLIKSLPLLLRGGSLVFKPCFSGSNSHNLYIPGDGIDFWKPHKWREEIEKYQVLCMVHDVFKIALHHDFFHMNRVNLLIVDECHHSFGNSPFNQIFKEHYHPLKQRYPGKYTYLF